MAGARVHHDIRPAARARSAAASSITPSCSHTASMPSRSFSAIAWSTTATDPLTVHKAVHDLDRAGDVSESAISPLSQGILTAKIDWDDAHAELVAQILADAVRGALGIGGQADHRPGRRRRQQPFDDLGVTPRPHGTDPCRSDRRSVTRGGWMRTGEAG